MYGLGLDQLTHLTRLTDLFQFGIDLQSCLHVEILHFEAFTTVPPCLDQVLAESRT